MQVGEALFPCLVVRTDLPPPPTSRAVAVAVSGHAHSRALAAWVASALLRPGDAVALLHSHKGPGAAQGCTAPAEGALRGAGFEPAVEALPGGESPGAGLATWCAAHPPTVLVVGSRGRGRLRPVAAHAVAHAPCPVVVVNGGLLEGPAGGGAAA